MIAHHFRIGIFAAVVAVAPTIGAIAKCSANETPENKEVSRGLVVHLPCGDGKQTASLCVGENTLVQGLDTEASNVAAARETFHALGLGGRATAAQFDGRNLPYGENMVNTVIAEDLGDVPVAEVVRALRPGGTAFVKRNGDFEKIVKPWPEEIDDWTHYLYDSKGTSVSRDTLAGHPGGLQWAGGPFWARSHEHTASLTAMVSAAGRVFYVMDEGPTASVQLPAQFVLTARDAFNGVVLWKRPLDGWWNALYPLKSGPGWLPRRLVAVGDNVYLAPGFGQNVVCLDAASGKVVREYENTASTFELIVSDGVVFAAVDPDEEPCDYNQQNADCWKERDRASRLFAWNRETGSRMVKAIDAQSGDVLWQRETPLVPMTLAADARIVCFYDGDAVVALDRATGDELWKSDVLDMPRVLTGYSGPRMVLTGDRIVLSPTRQMVALSATSGEVLWTVEGKPVSGHYSLEDFYVIDGVIWVLQRGNAGAYNTYSLETGELLAQHKNPIKSFYIHQRCYPGRATERYQLPPMMGIMVYDMEEDAWFNNHWVRGSCIYGVMPANGMVYATPHACACYYQSKLNGFNALKPEPQPSEPLPLESRWVKGPAFGAAQTTAYGADEWPVFRHDNTRSGYAKTDVPAALGAAWEKDFGTKLSQPVVADGTIFVSAIDEHTVYAIDAQSGEQLWRFQAAGRVDSPPTIHAGLALFGCADGWIYALDASDGRLAWKFLAAPNDRKIVSFGQVESVWPVSGSVLVQDGKLYAVAGRSMFLDGGLRMLILDPETGQPIAEKVMDRDVPGTDQKLDDLIMGKHMPVAMPDILSGDGQYVYMKSQTFTPDGERVRVRPQRPDTQYDEEVHLFSPISFLDDSWHQRTYWIYGRAAGEGWAEFQFPPKRVPCGRIVCIDEENAYGYGRDPELLCNTSVSEYRLYAAAKTPSRKVGIQRLEGTWIDGEYPDDKSLASNSVNWHKLASLSADRLTALDYHWLDDEPQVMARAMVLAGDTLFVAGPRDVVDEKSMWGRSNSELFKDKMEEQAAWMRGDRGGVLQAFSKTSGEKLSEQELPCLPAFDGMIAARGSLFLVTEDGSLVCYRGE